MKIFKAKDVEKTYKELIGEFESYINLLSFSIDVKISNDLEQLKADKDDFNKYIVEMLGDIGGNVEEIKSQVTNLSNQFSSTIEKVNTVSNTMEKFMNENTKNQVTIDNIFQVQPLEFNDYVVDEDEKSRKDGRVTKWYNVRNEGEELAFKTIADNEDQKIVQNQVTILKELHNCQNIIKFYGLTCARNNKWYLVTEWAQYGNLREYYTNYKDRFNLRLKLRMSLDIARGLSFLKAVKIVHRDIRAENILITINEIAKLANFKLSRYLTEDTLNHKQNVERARYSAPELLTRAQNFQYDQRCEVYSFGILLWEIAEERVPYQDSNDIMVIADKVCNKMYREPFSENSQMPKEFKELATDAVLHDPVVRPKITKMLEVLRSCVYHQDLSGSCSPNPSRHNSIKNPPKRAFSIDQADEFALPINFPDYESFKYMTLTDAVKQHRLVRDGKIFGDLKTAYKCFEAYANFANTAKHNQIIAKYYKVYYISKKYVESPPNKDKIIAELSKEVADDEKNEFPEAKIRYADCLLHGKGVAKNESEALKYFEKATDDGLKVAMYNAGHMHFNGIGCEKNKEKAKKYIELAVINGYEPAIKFREKNHL
ncbi:kinase-like domain-containing protein [Rhizophagus diaphanus]|nr:kinase-like domain-containing protein [Rhizophagus diaphanus] [Rhizophagus sp. MUCL 43196]